MKYSEDNFNKLYSENTILKSDNNLLKVSLKEKDKHYMTIINAKNKQIRELEEELTNLKIKQERLF